MKKQKRNPKFKSGDKVLWINKHEAVVQRYDPDLDEYLCECFGDECWFVEKDLKLRTT